MQLVGRPARVDTPPGSRRRCRAAISPSAEPVHRGQVEHAAGLHVLPARSRATRRTRRPACRRPPRPRSRRSPRGRPGGRRSASSSRPSPRAARRRVDQHLDHADVAEQQHVDVPEMRRAAVGRLVLGDPGDPPLARHRLGQILAQVAVLPRRIVGEIRRQHRVERVHQRLDLGGATRSGDPTRAPSPVQLAANGGSAGSALVRHKCARRHAMSALGCRSRWPRRTPPGRTAARRCRTGSRPTSRSALDMSRPPVHR